MTSWTGVGAAYDASYASLCAGTNDVLLDVLGMPRGRRLLDAGSGTGILAARLHDVGWDVTGCEPESSMRTVAAQHHPRISFVDGALPSLPFPDAAFDGAAANFVLNHVDEPRRSARDLSRVVASGGALAASIWTLSPSWFWRAVCEHAGVASSAGVGLPVEQDFERSASGFGQMLADAGWQRVEVRELSWTWHAAPATLWASAEGGVASAGTLYLTLDDAARRRFRSAFDDLCAERTQNGLIGLDHTAAIALGASG